MDDIPEIKPAEFFPGALLPNHDEGIAAVAALAKKASGEFRAETLKAPAGAVGVPAEIPVMIRTGETPEIKPLKDIFEKYRTAPERRVGTARVTTLACFIALTTRHKDDHSAIFAKTAWPDPKLTAVIDYHQTSGEARFGQHRIEYPFPISSEFKAWMDRNGQAFGQADFAAYVEDRIADLGAPTQEEALEFETLFKTRFATPAEMVDLSRGLQVTVAANVKNAHVLQSGEVEINWTEEHRDQAGNKIIVPGLFMLSVAAFIDGDPIRIPARLRYRVRDGKIAWSFHLYKWDFWLRDRIKGDIDEAAYQTDLPAYEGAPENA